MPPYNNWDVSLSQIGFLEKVLDTHKRVVSFERERDILFRIVRTGKLPPLDAVLINRYTMGVADVMGVEAEFSGITCVVTAGDWCAYTQEAKEYGYRQNVGVFNTSEFFGALWHRDVVNYVRKDLLGRPTYAFRAA